MALERVVAHGSRFQYVGGSRFNPHGFQGAVSEVVSQSESTTDAALGRAHDLGANVVRFHVQTYDIASAARTVIPGALEKLQWAVDRADQLDLYVVLTGLLNWYPSRRLAYLDALSEAERHNHQAWWWRQVANAMNPYTNIFGLELINEPSVPATAQTVWYYGGGFGGEAQFAERLVLDLAGRNAQTVARAWLQKMVVAIRGTSA